VGVLGPIAAEMARLMTDPAELDRLLARGAARARSVADPVLAQVYGTVGFLPSI
jgi:tryptophanyl-tRNA synthetase